MKKNFEKPYQTRGSFDEEWMAHKKCQDWWYCTGVLNDSDGKLYSYQFTILRLSVFGFRIYPLMLALTDFSTEKHYYYQTISFSSKHFTLTPNEVSYGGMARAVKYKTGMSLAVHHNRFALDIELDFGKGAVWHCDDGNLIMGIRDGKYTTQYYSYPNMPTKGTLTLNGKKIEIVGKTWFDKQYGKFPLLNSLTHWEWFSLRFDDEEEIMLFSFPQDDYKDGTYIKKDGSYTRLTNYFIEPVDFVYPDGRTKYSCKWNIQLPGLKEEKYIIKPLLNGQMNIGYYELLAGIYNSDEKQTGYCFVELLPGARNRRFPLKLFNKVNSE